MEKLIQKFAADRSIRTASAVLRHLNKHPMSRLMLNKDQDCLLHEAWQVIARTGSDLG